LAARARVIGEFRPLLRGISGNLLPDGTLADDASVALRRLRRDVERQHRRIHESLDRFLQAHREEGILQEEFVTIRNERFVVPLVAGRQRRVDGVIHGASGTGHTLFLEPIETIGLNNELVHLTEEALREEHRILREMTDHLRQSAGEIESAVDAIGDLEFAFGKARFALKFGGVIPRFSHPEDRRLALLDARHPLLEAVLARQSKTVVPISVNLDTERNTLLISGPNTGGKTVSLKTVGLLALMAQAGFPVTCAEAELPIFDEVLADIGDNQSIEQSLSTFSAHIASIREMIHEVSPNSLVLLDELGRATDPEEGGALGVAVLDEFRSSGALTLASTHLLALKVYGANTGGVVNGSMGFDDETLEPTYHLRTGAPGKSAGLDIASRLGLPDSLIEKARCNMSASERDLAQFLNQLHARLENATRLERELEEQNRDLTTRRENLADEWRRRETSRLAELERRVEEAIAGFEARAATTIEEIERDAKERTASIQARRKVARARREFQEQMQEVVRGTTEITEPKGRLEVGATVRLRGVRQAGRVSRILGKEMIEIQAGYLKLQVSVDDILEILPPTEQKSKLPKNVTVQAGPRVFVTTQELNLIGRRAEEAREELEKFLDSALLAEADRVRIIHGHGMGVLRKMVAELLSTNPNVAKFYPASPSEGGTGATVAEFKE
jgi:DNA mismatch repair protein MutS2